MSITILGQNIRLVRPEKVNQPRIYRDENPIIKYNKRSKRIKERSGKVIGICICTVTGQVFSLAKGIHATVCEYYGIKPEEVKSTGWILEGDRVVWR